MANKKVKELRELTDQEILNKISDCKKELFNLMLSQSRGDLVKSSRIHELRKSIARMNTIRRERELAVKEEI